MPYRLAILQKFLIIVLVATLGCVATAGLWAAVKLQNEDIGLFIASDLQSQFYPVKMPANEIPYLNIENILQYWFGLRSHCDVKALMCTAVIPPDGITAVLDGRKKQLRYGKTVSALPDNALVRQDGKLWLSYTALARWLPVDVQWSLQKYSLQIIPQFRLPREIKKQHAAQVQHEKEVKRHQSQFEHTLADQPKDPLSIESRYRADWSVDQQLFSQLGLSTETNVDVFKGTLYAAGNLGFDISPSETDAIYWNYSVTKPGQVNLLRVGHTETDNTLLLPYLTLKRAIEFNRLKPAQGGGGGFQYVGRTMPGTEVDVYRDGVLLTTAIAASDGSYKIDQPNAMQGDIFTIKFYYRDGTHSEKQIVIASDYGLVLAKNNFNVEAVAGQIDKGNTPHYSHFAWRYGVFNNLTLGAHLLELPSGVNNVAGAGMIDIAWRPKSWWDVIAETMRYNVGTDYAMESNITYFQHHNIRLTMKHISNNSPLLYMRDLSAVDTLVSTLYDSDQSWSVEDIYNKNSWRFSSKYINDLGSQTLNESITGNISEKLSTTAEGGYSFSKNSDDSDNGFALASLNYQLTESQLVTLGHTWQTNSVGQTLINYRLQGNGYTQWDTNIGLLIPNHGNITFSGSLSWRAHRHWMLSATFDNSSVNAVLSFQGIFSRGSQYRRYDDFGTGSVAGYVYAPRGDDQHAAAKPLEGVRVAVGDAYAVTDKHGYYFIAGVPVAQKLEVRVSEGTLDAEYMLDKHMEVVMLRPGTVVRYNPVIDWAGGIDGRVISDIVIGDDAQIIAKRVGDGEVIAQSAVEPDGFFVLDKLPVGKYELVVKPDKSSKQRAMKKVTIPKSSDWLSDVKLVLHQAAVRRMHG